MSFVDKGFELIEKFITPLQTASLLDLLAKLEVPPLRGGLRRIDQLIPQVAQLAKSETLINAAQKRLTSTPKLVRAIYFDKSSENNWLVAWHQDKTVAVTEKFENDEWGPWSKKAGVWHVQPPLSVLENMITIRIHLDEATSANGCLKIVAGSHKHGLLTNQKSQTLNKNNVVYCEVAAGGALVMRPHVLHASEKSSVNRPRRVLHFEYSSYELPGDIAWAA
jgi:ectoine hydroxylase-related dioxygenase (phytanoyl-CoA dioxygenase family)